MYRQFSSHHRTHDTILQQGYSLLEEQQKEVGTWRYTAQKSLENLSNIETAASIDLSLLLVDHLVRNHPETMQDREFWEPLLHRWQAVSKVEEECVAPEKVLALMDGWTTELRKLYPDMKSLVSWKMLSYMIAASQRRFKKMGNASSVQEAEFTEGLLIRMATEYSTLPSTTNLNAVLSMWAHLGNADRTQRLVAKSKAWGISADDHTHGHVLQSLRDYPEQAEAVLYKLHRDPNVTLSITSWNIVLNAWAKQQNTKRIEQLLNSMEVPPNLITYNTALSAWGRAGKTEYCEQLVAEMHQAHKSGHLISPPDMFTYSSLLNAYAKAGKAEEAEALANELYTEYAQNGRDDLKPTLRNYTQILKAYDNYISMAASKQNKDRALFGLARARFVINRMNGLYKFGALEDPPDSTAFQALLQCYQSAAPVAPIAEAAEEILREMQALPNIPNSDFTPYSIVIQIWLQQGDDGIRRAMELFDEAWKDQSIRANMDSTSLHTIIVGFSRAGKPGMAKDILFRWCREVSSKKMVALPTVKSFGSIIGAWRRYDSQRSPFEADKVFMLLESLKERKMVIGKIDCMIYEGVMTSWCFGVSEKHATKAYSYLSKMHQEAEKGDKTMFPTRDFYHRVIDACGRGNPDPELAEKILSEMIHYTGRGAHTLAPSTRSFNTVLSAWRKSNHGDAAKRAYALFEYMMGHRFEPDLITYTSLLNCLAKGSNQLDAERAENLLRKIQPEFSKVNSNDIVSLYGSVLTAWCRARKSERAYAILMELCQAFLKGEIATRPAAWKFDITTKCLRKDNNSFSEGRMVEVENMKQRTMQRQAPLKPVVEPPSR